jgi:hypothetical protein
MLIGFSGEVQLIVYRTSAMFGEGSILEEDDKAMSPRRTEHGSLSDAILRVMRPSSVYTVQHLAKRLPSFSPSNSEIRAALDALIAERKVEVFGFFMRSPNYRLPSNSAPEARAELTDYAESLKRRAELATLARRK